MLKQLILTYLIIPFISIEEFTDRMIMDKRALVIKAIESFNDIWNILFLLT